jgi:hypothetical protein
MLEELTQEHSELMIQVRDEWINRFFDNVKEQRGIDKPLFEDGIAWLYDDIIHKPPPKIIYCDSWVSCLLAIATLEEQHPVEASVGDSVKQLFSQYSYYGDISDFGWVAYCDFFSRIGISKDEKFEKYKSFIKSCPFAIYPYETYVFAIQPPIYIERNGAGRLHSTTGVAVKFRDGSGYYFINGRAVPEWVIENRGKITREQFLKENNAEIKGAIYEVLGQQGIMNLLGAETVDIKTINHANGDAEIVELLKTRDKFREIDNQPFAWVKVVCPSTGTNYLLGVEPHHTDAAEALASLSMFDKNEYSFNYRT